MATSIPNFDAVSTQNPRSSYTSADDFRQQSFEHLPPTDDFLPRQPSIGTEDSFDSAKLWDKEENAAEPTIIQSSLPSQPPHCSYKDSAHGGVPLMYVDTYTETTSATGTPAQRVAMQPATAQTVIHRNTSETKVSRTVTSSGVAQGNAVYSTLAGSHTLNPQDQQPLRHPHYPGVSAAQPCPPSDNPNAFRPASAMLTKPTDQTSTAVKLTETSIEHRGTSSNSSVLRMKGERHNSEAAEPDFPANSCAVPDCPAKVFLTFIGHTLHRSDEEMAPILKKVVSENWLETVSHLKNLSLADWENLGLPRQFLRCVLQNLPNADAISLGVPAAVGASSKRGYTTAELTVADVVTAYTRSLGHRADASYGTMPPDRILGVQAESAIDSSPQKNAVMHFVAQACVSHHVPLDAVVDAIRCLLDEHWFDSIDQLRSLSSTQWTNLGLLPNIAEILQASLALEEDDSLERIVIRAGSALGRTKEQLQESLQKLRASNKRTAEQLRCMTQQEWVDLKLPLRLQEEILRLVTDTSAGGTLGQSGHGGVTQISVSPFSGPAFRRLDSYPIGDPRIVSTKEEREARLVTVQRLLLRAGKRAGKSDADMAPIIQKVMHDNWVDSVRALRAMPQAEWMDIGIPKRIAEALSLSMVDARALELNTVQLATPEPDLFPCDVVSAVWRLESEVPVEYLPDTIRSLLKLMETILCNPFDEARRLIRKSNPNFQTRAGKYKSALLFLESVGFEEFGDIYVLFVAYVSRLTEAHAALAQLAHVLRDRLKKAKSSKVALFSSLRYS